MVVANKVVKIIEFGLTLPASILIFNMVKGINCMDEILITKNIIISGDAFFLFLFNVCNSFIAFKPKAVAPFPAPNIFNTIFITI